LTADANDNNKSVNKIGYISRKGAVKSCIIYALTLEVHDRRLSVKLNTVPTIAPTALAPLAAFKTATGHF
jgi:hypothetical protein